MVELTGDDLKFFAEFEKVTRTMPSDYLSTPTTLIFLVDMAQLGRSIGKGGANIKRLTQLFRKKVVIVGDSNDPEMFIRSYFSNVAVRNVEIRDVMGEKAIMLTVDEKDRGMTIGKDGDRIKAAKALLLKKFKATLHLRTARSIMEGL